MQHQTNLSSSDARQFLLRLAREAVELAAREHKHIRLPADLAPELKHKKGAFVTLNKQGDLRGCIGNIYPDLPLAEAVASNAYRAALNDPRFPPVAPEELAEIEIEVSVLSVPEPLDFSLPAELLEKLQPHRDGVVLQIGTHRSTFLPQVWEKLPNPEEFLNHLSAKAGLPSDAWRKSGTQIQIYHVEAFTESELHGGARQ